MFSINYDPVHIDCSLCKQLEQLLPLYKGINDDIDKLESQIQHLLTENASKYKRLVNNTFLSQPFCQLSKLIVFMWYKCADENQLRRWKEEIVIQRQELQIVMEAENLHPSDSLSQVAQITPKLANLCPKLAYLATASILWGPLVGAPKVIFPVIKDESIRSAFNHMRADPFLVDLEAEGKQNVDQNNNAKSPRLPFLVPPSAPPQANGKRKSKHSFLNPANKRQKKNEINGNNKNIAQVHSLKESCPQQVEKLKNFNHDQTSIAEKLALISELNFHIFDDHVDKQIVPSPNNEIRVDKSPTADARWPEVAVSPMTTVIESSLNKVDEIVGETGNHDYDGEWQVPLIEIERLDDEIRISEEDDNQQAKMLPPPPPLQLIPDISDTLNFKWEKSGRFFIANDTFVCTSSSPLKVQKFMF